MIADDTDAIRDAMRRHAQAKVQAQAEADRRAAEDAPTVNLPHPKPLFSESAAPFRGFFVSEDGDIVPLGGAAPETAWADWIDTQEGNLSAMGAVMLKDERTVQAANRASNRYTFWGFAGEDPDGA